MFTKVRKRSVFLTIFLSLIIFSSMTLPVFAAGTEIQTTAEDKAGLTALFKDKLSDSNKAFYLVPTTTDAFSKKALLSYDGDKLVLNNEEFDLATDKSKKAAVAEFAKQLQASSVSPQTQQNIFDEIGESNRDISAMLIPMIFNSTSADLFTAYKWLFPFLSALRVVFGVGAIAILLMLIGSTIIDLAYIGLPFWREAQADKTGKGGGRKPFGVSFDALSTVRETESSLDSSGKYKNSYLTYFGRRAFTYIILSICLLYLIVGEMGGLIGWLMSLASGIVT